MRLSLPLLRRPRLRLAVVSLIAAVMVASTILPLTAGASSHREAPNISQDPSADGTDLYAFRNPDGSQSVILVANYVPFQSPTGGPNFYRFGDDVEYQIHVDNVGDANDHIVFTFKFQSTTVNPNSFLYNVGPITFAGGAYQNWNRPQTYDVWMTNNGVTTRIGHNLLSPPVNVGKNSTPDYHRLASHAIYDLNGGIKVFAGQRADPFFADLGHIFDLLGVVSPGTNYLAGLNVSSIVLQVPISTLQGPNDSIIGLWTTSSRKATTVLNVDGTKTERGDYVQVSRLGMPLVNEVVIPLGKKDLFNATVLTPSSDGQFLSYVTTPELAALFVALGIDPNAPTTNRNDLVAVFLTGLQGVNQPAGVVASEQLRLNMAIAPTHSDPNQVNRMGVLGGENDGFPNGRRPGDDVVDIAMQVVDGILCQPGGPFPQCRPNNVNPGLGDGVDHTAKPFQLSFPYLADPYQG
ncbi:MAG TPA: DUF4331 domain-containing protein [Chloroflexota bacterium]|nr:DUF4331 domain-containing protein [Chloroflexota bacterium]